MEFSVITIISLTVSACLLIGSIKVLAAKGWILGFLRGAAGCLLIIAAVLVGLGGVNLSQYGSCGKSTSIANVSFEKEALQLYSATLVDTASGGKHNVQLDGDMWNVTVHKLKFPLAGGASFCKIASISTRYYSLEQQSRRATTFKAFPASTLGFDLWSFADGLLVPGVEATSESSAYMPMEEGILFSVKQGQSGIVVNSLNQNAE